MAEASNGRVTITLGPSGQVVKRAVSAAGYSDSLLGSGGKRSVRDRLGGDSEGSMYRGSQHGDKRHRSDSYLTAANSAGVRDARIGKGDLRFKLLQKNVGRRDQSDDDQWDLRDKLSKKAQSLSHPPAALGTGELMSYPRETSLLGGIPPSGSSSELSRREPSRNSYSPWTLDHIRRRSPGRIITASTPPDRGISTSRGFSPPRHVDEGQRRSLGRSIDDVRPVSYMTRDVRDAPRSMSSSTHFMPKPGLPTVSTKSAAAISAPVAPASNVPSKQTYAGDEQQTVEGLLHSLGLGKYAIIFKAEEVDMHALKQMGESDLKELGIPMGPRKKILLSVLPRSKRQPR
ncbi:unnamed protein product [Linum trigynum]|uniref:SAM domain-containing protein n=1 Tax=Linum trigynum TaxID=586398 RepID=A0AAV2CLW3_9ROSI